MAGLNVIETAARGLPEGAAASFLAEAQRVAAHVEQVDTAWLTCRHCQHAHRKSPTACPHVEPVPTTTEPAAGEVVMTATCPCTQFEGYVDDEERARIIRTVRGTEHLFEEQTAPADRLVAALVPERFRHKSLATYHALTPSQGAARRAVQQFVDRVQGGQPSMLALIGAVGSGKSHLAYAALQDLIVIFAGRWPIYARGWYRLADELRYGGQSPYTGQMLDPHEVRALLLAAKIVVLDEVRATAATEFDAQELAKVAAHAYDAGVSVLVTTNVNPLETVMGPAAASRFVQVVIDGPDGRQSGRDLAAGGDR